MLTVDAAERGSRILTGVVCKSDIAKRDNAHQALVAVRAANLDVGHIRRDFIELLIVEAVAVSGLISRTSLSGLLPSATAQTAMSRYQQVERHPDHQCHMEF